MWGARLQRRIDISVNFLKEKHYYNWCRLETFFGARNLSFVWRQQRNSTFTKWPRASDESFLRKKRIHFASVPSSNTVYREILIVRVGTGMGAQFCSLPVCCTYFYSGDLQSDFLCSFLRITMGGWERERLWEHLMKVVDPNLNAWRGLANIKWTDWNSNRNCD